MVENLSKLLWVERVPDGKDVSSEEVWVAPK